MLLEYNKKFNRTADSSCFDFYLIKELEIEKTEAILLPKTPHSLRLRYTLISLIVCLLQDLGQRPITAQMFYRIYRPLVYTTTTTTTRTNIPCNTSKNLPR